VNVKAHNYEFGWNHCFISFTFTKRCLLSVSQVAAIALNCPAYTKLFLPASDPGNGRDATVGFKTHEWQPFASLNIDKFEKVMD
jgi:hypothetical protein